MKRILVTGSRTWHAWEPVRAFLAEHGPGIIVHGGASGLDTIADRIAVELGWPVDPHPAQWRWVNGRCVNPWEGAARNQRMVDTGAAICGAFPGSYSVGTYDCAARAEHAEIRVVWVPAAGVHPDTVRGCMAAARRKLERHRLRGDL